MSGLNCLKAIYLSNLLMIAIQKYKVMQILILYIVSCFSWKLSLLYNLLLYI